MADIAERLSERYANDAEWQERRERYEELAEQIKGAWGERALAWCDGEEVLDYYAERDSSQLVCAWPDWLDEPALKTHHHQTIANHVRAEQNNESVELKIVDWDETPFPDEQDAWPLV